MLRHDTWETTVKQVLKYLLRLDISTVVESGVAEIPQTRIKARDSNDSDGSQANKGTRVEIRQALTGFDLANGRFG